MPRASSTWRSSLLAGSLLALLATGSGCERACWPPVVEGGQRLQPLDGMPVSWLPLLFGQHEVCWRPPASPGERRVFLTGSSGLFGFPHPAEQGVPARLNAQPFAVPVHFFNLGLMNSYQVKDALIIRSALDFEPDLIVHAIDLGDFVHVTPPSVGGLRAFHEGNRGLVSRFAREEPPGLADALALIDQELEASQSLPVWLEGWRQVGRFARFTAGSWALRARDLPGVRPASVETWIASVEVLKTQDKRYDCAATVALFDRWWGDWQAWSILDYLVDVRERTGTPVVVVAWPLAHLPRGRCYSVRFPKAQLAEFRAWIAERTRELDLPYLDYSSLLGTHDFIDSIHATPDGQRKIARRLASDLRPWLDAGAPSAR